MSIEQQAAEVADETNEQSAAVENQFAEADAKAEPVGLEQLASEMGWVPQEKFKGPTDKWKPADQFIRDGKDIQERLSRDLKGLRETVETIKLTNSQTMIDALAKQHAELSQRYAAAVEKGDPDEAWRAANAIQQVQARAANIGAPQVAPVAPETENWVQRNDRIQRDPIAWQRALQVCDAYARANPASSPAEQLQYTETHLRREYPHLFDDKGAPNVNSPTSRNSAGAPRGRTVADLPKEARDVAKDMVERGLIPSEEIYAKNYFAARDKRG
jgi:hypothetical protein